MVPMLQLFFTFLLLQQQAFAKSTKSGPKILFDTIPSNHLPGSYPSQGVECCGLVKQGAELDLVAPISSSTQLSSFTVVMEDWAKYADIAANNYPMTGISYNTNTWTYPITLELWSTDATTLLATKTQSFAIPWRPTSDTTKCTALTHGDCGGGDFGWYDKNSKQCFCGNAFDITFDLSGVSISGTSTYSSIVFAIAYNTATAGPVPNGVAGPYNSLNVAVPQGLTASTGTISGNFWGECVTGNTYCPSASGFFCGSDGSTFEVVPNSAAATCWQTYFYGVELIEAGK